MLMGEFVKLTKKHTKKKVSEATIRAVIKGVFLAIIDVVIHEDCISFSKFGTFGSRVHGAHGGRNKRTGEILVVPPTRVIKFQVAHSFRSLFRYCQKHPDKVDTAKLL